MIFAKAFAGERPRHRLACQLSDKEAKDRATDCCPKKIHQVDVDLNAANDASVTMIDPGMPAAGEGDAPLNSPSDFWPACQQTCITLLVKGLLMLTMTAGQCLDPALLSPPKEIKELNDKVMILTLASALLLTTQMKTTYLALWLIILPLTCLG